MADAVVTASRYRWTEGEGDEAVVHEADRGQTITVSDDELKRGQELGGLKPAGKSDDSSGESLPGTHKELDALAEERGVEWSEGTKTVADKQAALGGGSADGPAATGNTPGAAPREELEELSREELEERAKGTGLTDVGESSDEELITAIQAAGAIAPPPTS